VRPRATGMWLLLLVRRSYRRASGGCSDLCGSLPQQLDGGACDSVPAGVACSSAHRPDWCWGWLVVAMPAGGLLNVIPTSGPFGTVVSIFAWALLVPWKALAVAGVYIVIQASRWEGSFDHPRFDASTSSSFSRP